jgi:hypothetical protein
MSDEPVLYKAVYGNANDAVADLDTFAQLHDDELIGNYDAAVVDEENGKPHIVKRVDRPRVNVIPEMFGGGELKRSELNQAAEQLAPGEAALIVVGEPTIEKAFQKAVTRAEKTAKQQLNESAAAFADATHQA